jgi:penicillin-binding protein 1A
VRIASIIGIKRIKRVAKRLGIYEEESPENYSMVLGAKETTLLKLVNGYSMIANGGRRVSPWLIERIDDRNGAAIFRRDTRSCEACMVSTDIANANSVPPTIADERERVIDPRVAYQITSILQGAVQRGTGSAAKILNRPIAGKTGTTNDSRDTWFVGYTPDIVVGTYIGYDTPKPLGEKETGGRVAIAGFVKFMQQAGADIPDHPFRAPAGIREVPVNPEMPNAQREAFLTGGPIFKPMNELEEELKERGNRPAPKPEDIGDTPLDESGGFTPPAAGEMAPYQRPVDPEGFDPATGAGTGTGGVY